MKHEIWMTPLTLGELNTIKLDHQAESKCVQPGRVQVKPDSLVQHNIPETYANIDKVKEAWTIFKNETSNHTAIAKGSHSSHTTIYQH